MRILVITNVFPPHHGGTFDFRCQAVTDALKLRGHEVKILTSNLGLNTEQRDAEIERRLHLNGAFGEPSVTGYNDVKKIEVHNTNVLRESVDAFQPDLLYIWSLSGLSKSLIFSARNTRIPTVYDVADQWIAEEIKADPWLEFWNAPSPAGGSSVMRMSLELMGGRGRVDKEAPTRMMKGCERVPELYTRGAHPEPDSITAFRFDRIYFCSDYLKAATLNAGFRVGHASVIHPGVKVDQFMHEIRPMGAPVQKLLTVAKLDDRSGVLTAVEALKQLRDRNSKASLTIVGRGESDYVAQLRSKVILDQLPVEFATIGPHPRELLALMHKHDAYLHTSVSDEPYATTPLEAMAAGVPVIATCTGGIAEIVRHGENALSYTPGSAIELCSRIQELQLQPALRVQMCETAQAEVAAQHNEVAVVDAIEAYLQESIQIWQHT
ncbi:MAG TPA: glycosyltransferase family 4 protein [Methylomirabilota bacterium]|nr:glycosyltransferase family 4 protein [Methylomirabilota bacterium]